MTSVLCLRKRTSLLFSSYARVVPSPVSGYPAGWRSPLSRFTTLQTKDPWQIATDIAFSLGSSVESQGMPPAGLTVGQFQCDVYENVSQRFRSIDLWPLIH